MLLEVRYYKCVTGSTRYALLEVRYWKCVTISVLLEVTRYALLEVRYCTAAKDSYLDSYLCYLDSYLDRPVYLATSLQPRTVSELRCVVSVTLTRQADGACTSCVYKYIQYSSRTRFTHYGYSTMYVSSIVPLPLAFYPTVTLHQ